MSGWQRIGVVISVLWLIALPIYLTMDSNGRASVFYNWCRSVNSTFSERTTEQQHELCWRSAGFITPKVMAHTLIAGNADTATLWSLMLGPVVIFWIIGGIIFAMVRWMRRGFLRRPQIDAKSLRSQSRPFQGARWRESHARLFPTD
jgi:hypothetical protein